jgi:predicted nucleotidyltransferase
MGKWTKEKVTDELKTILGERLVSVVLYGSQAAGDHTNKNSDVNLLIVTKNLMTEELQALSKVIVPWVKEDNHPPLFLTRLHLKEFASVFPVEILDIQNNHQVLYGIDPLEGLAVSNDHLRIQLQHELQAKLLRLKTQFIMTESKPKAVQQLMVDSLSSFLVLFKNTLWLYDVKPDPQKMEALRQLKSSVAFDIEPFETVDHLKRGVEVGKLDILFTFRKYLSAIQSIVDNVDKLG